jgi:hypothetical protein
MKIIDPRKVKLQQIIEVGRISVLSGYESIKEETSKRLDIVAKPQVIEYRIDKKTMEPSLGGKNNKEKIYPELDTIIFPIINQKQYRLTDHSLAQLFSRASFPRIYAETLQHHGEAELLYQNLKTMTKNTMGDGVLLRSVDNLIKGWLSPNYWRMDAAPVFDSFIEHAIQKGFVPYRGYNMDYRYQIAFIYPEIYSPFKDEFIVFGLSLLTSDYGSGALQMEMMILRIRCMNLALGLDLFRRVHLGSRIKTDGEFIELSKRTHELDNRTIASAIGDVVNSSFKQIEFLKTVVGAAADKEVQDPKQFWDSLKRKGATKENIEQIKTAFESEMDIEYLPPQKSLWRMSSAISLIAQGQKNRDRRIDLEKMAMEVMVN